MFGRVGRGLRTAAGPWRTPTTTALPFCRPWHSSPVVSRARAPPSSKSKRASVPSATATAANTLRRFLEERGILAKADTRFDFISRKAVPPSPSPYALRRARLPNAKAKALALESKALREQVASQQAPIPSRTELGPSNAVQPWHEDDTRPTLPLTAMRIPSSDLPEAAAFATAQSYNFDVLLSSGRLSANWVWLEDREVIYIPAWPAPTTGEPVGSVFIFRSGCYTTWGLSPEQNAAFYNEVLRDDHVPVEQHRYTVAGDEAMEFVRLPNEATRIVGDLIVLGQPPEQPDRPSRLSHTSSTPGTPKSNAHGPSLSLQARLAFSQGLAASARLTVQESVLSEYATGVAPIPELLEANGKVPLSRRDVIRKLGSLLRIRQRLNLDRDNFIDDPELYWENSHMEALYRSICTALDMKPRIESMNAKLNHCENLLEVLRALLTEESSHRMELIIIYLIAFEVAMALVSHEYIPTPLTMWHWLRGTDAALTSPATI